MIAPNGLRPGRNASDEVRQDAGFLGPEFLTWLWWRSESDPRFERANGDPFFIHLDEYLELRGERAAARRAVLRSGMPSASVEARAALRSGKTLTSARLLLATGEEEVRFTLRAEDLDVSGLKLPAAEGDSAAERERVLLAQMTQFLDDLDQCFARFLDVRCSDAWEGELGHMRTWSGAPSQDEQAFTRTEARITAMQAADAIERGALERSALTNTTTESSAADGGAP